MFAFDQVASVLLSHHNVTGMFTYLDVRLHEASVNGGVFKLSEVHGAQETLSTSEGIEGEVNITRVEDKGRRRDKGVPRGAGVLISSVHRLKAGVT